MLPLHASAPAPCPALAKARPLAAGPAAKTNRRQSPRPTRRQGAGLDRKGSKQPRRQLGRRQSEEQAQRCLGTHAQRMSRTAIETTRVDVLSREMSSSTSSIR